MVLTRSRRSAIAETVCFPLPDGTWLAIQVLPENAACGPTKREAEEAVRQKVALRDRTLRSDFFGELDPARLTREQHVGAVHRLGQIRSIPQPDPEEADWLARQVRRWRREGGSGTRP
jgi:hypothetical protein